MNITSVIVVRRSGECRDSDNVAACGCWAGSEAAVIPGSSRQ